MARQRVQRLCDIQVRHRETGMGGPKLDAWAWDWVTCSVRCAWLALDPCFACALAVSCRLVEGRTGWWREWRAWTMGPASVHAREDVAINGGIRAAWVGSTLGVDTPRMGRAQVCTPHTDGGA